LMTEPLLYTSNQQAYDPGCVGQRSAGLLQRMPLQEWTRSNAWASSYLRIGAVNGTEGPAAVIDGVVIVNVPPGAAAEIGAVVMLNVPPGADAEINAVVMLKALLPGPVTAIGAVVILNAPPGALTMIGSVEMANVPPGADTAIGGVVIVNAPPAGAAESPALLITGPSIVAAGAGAARKDSIWLRPRTGRRITPRRSAASNRQV
jgi:hypothetical protein